MFIIATTLWGLTFGNTALAAIVNEPMTGSTAPGWVIGGNAYLTASTGVDPDGGGWLRLTEPLGNEAGFGFFNSAFDISSGAVIQFDYATWGGNGADGYSIYLFDGSYDASTFSVGASGGSLGYAQKTAAPFDPGLTGGYIGVGIDEYGNFSNPTEGRVGGTGFYPNEVGVRGPTNNDPTGVTGYPWLGGSGTLGTPLAFNNQGYRPIQTGTQYRKVVIYLTPVSAPNYLRVDVYVEFGFNQPLTPVVTGLYTGRPVPASVKIGYAASTGGSTNYHEIRNLVVNPLQTDINLAMVKVASSPTVTQGGPLTYTLTAHNYGPNPTITATNAPITDTIPALLTGATWTCSGTGGGTCGAASGSGSINTTATLPFNASVSYTIRSTVSAAAPLGSTITNIAAIAAPTGVTDYNSSDNSSSVDISVTGPLVNVSGMVYNDANHNGVQNVGENSTNVAGIYAKLFRTSDLSNAVSVVAVNQTTGAFTFNNVPSYDTYTIILSDNNNSADPTPGFPSGQWIYTVPLNYTLSDISVGGSNVTGLLLGMYQGSRIDGKVIKDDGFNGATANANDGVLNAAETGIVGVTVTLTNNTGGTQYDTTTTGTGGTFSLYTNLTSRTLRIYETNPANYLSVSYNAGTTGGTYTIGGEYIQFAYTQYTDYTGVLFGDVPDNTFAPASRAQSGNSLVPIYYAQTFTPGSGGSVTFAANSRTQGGWPAVVYYNDTACNGTYDSGTDTVISGALTAYAGTPICILAQVTIPPTALNGNTDALVTRATFTFTNSVGPVVTTYDVTDTTTVAAPDLSTSTKTWTDLNGGDQNPNDSVRYTITVTNTSSLVATGVTATDTIPATLTSPSIVSCPSSSCGIGGQTLTAANITVPANSSVVFVFDATIAGGTPAGTLIDNTATITNPAGPGATPAASTIIVSGSSIPVSGNKSLYLYGAPGLQLSRTPTPGVPAAVTIARGGNSQTWALTPSLRLPVTISATLSPTVPVQLWLATNSNRNYPVEVRLACSSDTTTYLSDTQTIGLNGTPALFTFHLSAQPSATFTTMSCGTGVGEAWQLTIFNNMGTGGGQRNVLVYPVDPGSGAISQASLPSLNVINVDSTTVSNAAYPGGVTLATAPSGTTVYVRSVVSDPFGSFDITSASSIITDPTGSVRVNGLAMTQVADSGAATKTYEYAYAIPAAGPAGNWTFRVTAQEGTEGTISDYGLASLPVTLPAPNILTLKSVSVISDPINTSPPYRSIPGAVMQYTVTASNQGAGSPDAGSLVLTDPIPQNVSLYVGDIGAPGSGPIAFTDGSPSSGLSYTFLGLGSNTDSIEFSNTVGGPPYTYGYTPTADANGFDSNVRSIRITLGGAFAFSAGAPYPSFTLQFRVKVK
jgi:uncharacterized repeat protein (TIGR01451 family)